MTVSATEGVATAGIGSLMPTSDTSTNSMNKDAFLQILVAQMRYQDPLNPTDSGQFLAQSAQFTALEKMQDVADRTAALVGVQLAFGASALVGRSVDYQLADGTIGQGAVTGVRFEATGPILEVAGTDVPVANVTGVASTSGSSTSGTTPTDGASARVAAPDISRTTS